MAAPASGVPAPVSDADDILDDYLSPSMARCLIRLCELGTVEFGVNDVVLPVALADLGLAERIGAPQRRGYRPTPFGHDVFAVMIERNGTRAL